MTRAKALSKSPKRVDIIERRFVIKKHRRQKYKCQLRQLHQDGARSSEALRRRALLGGLCGARSHGQVRRPSAFGATSPRHEARRSRSSTHRRCGIKSTLWLRHLEPAYERLQRIRADPACHRRRRNALEADGRKGQEEGGKGKRWQAWAICCPDAVHYSFEDSRSAETAKTCSKDFGGVVLTDGYVAYGSVKKRGGTFTLAHCWAHVRRKFVEVEDQHPGRCAEVLDLIGQLYEIEDAGERKTTRRSAGAPQGALEEQSSSRSRSGRSRQKLSPKATSARAIKYMGSAVGRSACLPRRPERRARQQRHRTCAARHRRRQEEPLRLALRAWHRSRGHPLHA